MNQKKAKKLKKEKREFIETIQKLSTLTLPETVTRLSDGKYVIAEKLEKPSES